MTGYADTNRIRKPIRPHAPTNVSPAKKPGANQIVSAKANWEIALRIKADSRGRDSWRKRENRRAGLGWPGRVINLRTDPRIRFAVAGLFNTFFGLLAFSLPVLIGLPAPTSLAIAVALSAAINFCPTVLHFSVVFLPGLLDIF